MSSIDGTNESPANTLCKSCGLCCTGHLFSRTKLRSAELDSARALGLHVFGSEPSQRGFSQPCPLWQGQCTIYTTSDYPHFCRTYKCKLLKEVLDENTSLPDALVAVEQAKGMIRELEALLPGSPDMNFRERFVAHLENPERLKASTAQEAADLNLQRKADSLSIIYEQVFGVKDLVDQPNEE
ncbi:MAG TPA: YkgJ family cysteine cluster protein [Anaerolineales bacterium]|nr:YkgJ family cysteine cluster protein [Anaerolineales bacterium]